MSDQGTPWLSKRRWSVGVIGLLVVWLMITLLHLYLYRNTRQAILDEVRHHAMGVAIAAAAGLDLDLLDQIHGPDDMEREAFRRIQRRLARISRNNPDVRFIYTMRRSRDSSAPEGMYEFIVDQSPVDWDGSGVIEPSEASEDPGEPYDASDLPEMIRGWERPAADFEITPDPPWGDLLSGYAPVRDDDGVTRALVGVDVTAETIKAKIRAVSVALAVGWVGLMALTWVIYLLYCRQRKAMDHIRSLNLTLEQRNQQLNIANEKIVAHYRQVEEEMQLAQTVQMGMLPQRFPRQDRILFQKYYLTCAILGGDLFDVFEVDDRRVGLFMADVSGHGVSAALISGLVKMAISTVREMSRDASATYRVDLGHPAEVVRVLNDILIHEIPDEDFITMIYAVIDVETNQMIAASAGHPWPILRSGQGVVSLGHDTKTGPALSLVADATYPMMDVTLREGDVLLFFTDGLTEAMNQAGEEFGEERMLEVVEKTRVVSADAVVQSIREAVDQHRAGCEVSDDFTLLAAEIRSRT